MRRDTLWFTPHDHRVRVEGCFRCDLSDDEVFQVWTDAKVVTIDSRGMDITPNPFGARL